MYKANGRIYSISFSKIVMRLNRLNVPQNESKSFDLRHEVVTHFSNPWHFHPEIELNYVVQGTGTRITGQSVERFESGDIILIGKNLPHFWKSEVPPNHVSSNYSAEAIIARFSEDFVGKDFLQLPETRSINGLFRRSLDGLKLLEPLRTEIASDLVQLLTKEGFGQLVYLLTILQKIAESNCVQVISRGYIPGHLQTKNNDRLSKVIAYLLENFSSVISLQEIAEIANMNEAAFCRYFKSQTNLTLTQYLTALRIRYASELLINSEDSISQVCFQVGFENVSHFIQSFKKILNETPLEYRKKRTRLD
jgi:AraC-like DNA-binding protein